MHRNESRPDRGLGAFLRTLWACRSTKGPLDPRTPRAPLKLLETVKPQIALLRARLARRAAPLPLLEHPRVLNQRRVGDQT
jgi:hypothetical protein